MENRWMDLLQETHDSALRSEEKVIGLEQTCGKTEIHLAALNGHVDNHTKEIEAVKNRVTRTETKIWVLFGAGGAAVSLVTLLRMFGVI